MNITDFLLARIAEDEAAALAVEPLGVSVDFGMNEQPDYWIHQHGQWDAGGYPAVKYHDRTDVADAKRRKAQAVVAHFDRHDPARVLAECEAKRRIVALHDQSGERWTGFPRADKREAYCRCDQAASPCDTLRVLAAVYADHPDYDEAWRP